MTVSAEYLDFVVEMLEPLGDITSRRMFGGAGVYLDGVMFALIDDDRLFLRVDGQTRGLFEAEGAGPFSFVMKGEEKAMRGYYQAPDHLLEDAEEMAIWARSAHDTALRIRAAKNKK